VTITRDDVLKALAGVAVDAGGTSLPASRRLSEIVIDPSNRVMFSIVVTAAEAKAFEPVRQAAEIAVLKIPGVKGAFASLTNERAPAPPSGAAANGPPVRASGGPGHAHGHSHAPARGGPGGGAPRPGPALPGVRHVVAVASGKGGVGKSTTACNLALALKAQGLKVGLLDADIYGPSVPKLFGLDQKPETIDTPQGQRIVPLNGYGLPVMSIGFLIQADTAMIWRGPMVQSALTQLLREVAWGELDVLIVDMPPGTGDAQLTMAQATPLAGAVIVSTPQDLALIDARRGVTMFRRVEVPILGVIENMATFICPHCGGASHIFGHGGARVEAQRLGVPFLGEVPLTMAIRESSDAGRPVVAVDPDSPQATVYRDIAAALWANLSGAPAGRQAPRIVIE
jgi:ATP-binding protein involved in chromosome partitioning